MPEKRLPAVLSLLAVILTTIFSFPAVTALAFRPPLDKAGPLKVKIDGPELVTSMESPLAVGVVLSNNAESPITGKLRLAAIDSWRVKPSGEIDFEVPAGETVTKFSASSPGVEPTAPTTHFTPTPSLSTPARP